MSTAPVQPSPQAPLEIAKLLRHHKDLKQRQGLFQSRTVDFFRYKRFIRALKSQEYAKKSTNQPDLYPPLTGSTEEEQNSKAREIFINLIKSQLILPAIKLHSHECKEHGLKPNKDYPNLIISQKANLRDDEYYIWNYNKKSIMDILTVVGIISVILALVLYPLWPKSMRRASYYVSLACLGLLGAFFIIAIIRFILYIISLTFAKEKGGFWLFPNLFEDCGILDSFKPFYGFGEKDSYSYIKKMKRLKKKQAKKDKSATATIEEKKND
ncbi:hypothetical protein KAFR_0E00760 [Kazachstania africana CBS 2517]|uniref:Translocation protein SEC62 n=1 Tax=Kazachstania africana (strain ATCC 22294 / BCRC 22015 / CBS 2517 / CECT 1963 / NBRC 1671 / NRRL Y-8276) TaxID=1071382 RepID=H2AV30_KAZAF|nr:hypothetical protein KAFR_0E00760 [Kazachstania africana CBS 2517]CCF58230.1 hypothetical protein KAFR_0E00760 [Kazachstania africana CBS 2517]